MNRSTARLVLVVLAGLIASPALAAELGIGLRAGTQGVGAELGVGVTPWFTVRAGAYTLDISESYESDGVDYDGDLTLGGYGVLADFFPLRGGFHLTAGLFSNRNAIDLSAVPTAPIEIGNTTYDPAEVGLLTGSVEFDDTAPYLGIGWGNAARGKRLGFLFDLGVLRQGSGQVGLRSSTGLVDPDDIAAEIAEIENDIDNYDYWPVVSFGLAIRF